MSLFYFMNHNNSIEQTREFLIGALSTSKVIVHFTKKDGTERRMVCTLDPNLIPVTEKKTDRTKEPNPEVIPVYDLEADGWRSFRIDSIVSISFDL